MRTFTLLAALAALAVTFFGNSGTRVGFTNGPKRVRFFYGV